MTRPHLLRFVAFLYLLALVVALASLHPWPAWHHGKSGKFQKGRLAVVHIYGAIHSGWTSSAWGPSSAEDVAADLHQIAEDDSVKAIVLRINSPGGTVGAVQEIYTEIRKCKDKGKKVVASMGDVAASGGYYIASAADRIVANPGTITGSIGVIFEFPNVERLLDKIGARLEVIKSGAHKDIGSPARPLTPEERQLLQGTIDDAYQQFVQVVTEGRKIPPEKVKVLADGRIFTGLQAKQAGLVDDIGDSQDALQEAIKLANLEPHPVILSDSPRSLAAVMRHLSSWSPVAWLESLRQSGSGVSLEYRL